MTLQRIRQVWNQQLRCLRCQKPGAMSPPDSPSQNRSHHKLLLFGVLLWRLEHSSHLGQSLKNLALFLCPRPQDRLVLLTIAIAILYGRLRLADPTQASDRLAEGRGVFFVKGFIEPLDDIIAADEVLIASVGNVPGQEPGLSSYSSTSTNKVMPKVSTQTARPNTCTRAALLVWVARRKKRRLSK